MDSFHQDANMREARPLEAAKRSTDTFQIRKLPARDPGHGGQQLALPQGRSQYRRQRA